MALIVIYHGLYLFTRRGLLHTVQCPLWFTVMPVAVDWLCHLPRCRFWRGVCIGMMAALLLQPVAATTITQSFGRAA